MASTDGPIDFHFTGTGIRKVKSNKIAASEYGTLLQYHPRTAYPQSSEIKAADISYRMSRPVQSNTSREAKRMLATNF